MKPQILTVRSSAGSGKTYRLAEHYLKVLLASALADTTLQTRMANVVAITFTNKASQEMRARILDWMKRIILDLPFENSSAKPLDAIMEGITTVSPDQDDHRSPDCAPGNGLTADAPSASRTQKLRAYLMGAMNRRFSELLKDFGHFNVGTIDSFVNLTLKASAMQLNLPPDFEVSTETNELIDLALRQCLQKTTDDASARATFNIFIDSYIELEGDHTSWVPRELLKAAVTTLWNEETKENMDIHMPEDTARPAAAAMRKKISQKARSLISSIAADEKMLPLANAVKAMEKCADPFGDALASSVYFELPLTGCLKKGSTPPGAPQQELWEELAGLRLAYAEILASSKYLPYLEVYSLFKEVFRREVTHFRRVIPIEELNRLLQDVMKRRDFVPEIYYALAERYIHFLIDEFQDTSLLQWKNIEVLAGEALGRGGTLFLVGDKKQAIYRWRGGRADLVDDVARRFGSYYPAEKLDLDTNYRSGEQIVFFNNEVFDAEHLSVLAGSILKEHPPESLEKIVAPYQDARQRFLEIKKGRGYVEVERVTIPTEEDDPRDVFTKEEALGIIEERLRGIMERVMARGAFHERDIAVLVRTREEAKTAVRVLLSMDLSVESEYTVSIRNNPLIGEVLSFLKFIDKPDDDFSFASFITGRIFAGRTGMDAGAMAGWLSRKYLTNRPGVLYNEFRSDFGKIFDDHFSGFLTKAGYLPLYDLVVSFFKQWEVLARFSRDVPYFLHLLELVRQREEREGGSIAGFVSFFEPTASGPSYGGASDDDRAFLLPASDSLNAVRVLTIHKAKGLQFPVVILPFAALTTFSASSGRDKQRYFQSSDEGLKLLYLKKEYTRVSPGLAALYRTKEWEYLTDELNNLYVAFTRAEEELYVLLADGKKRKNHLIDHLFGLKELGPHLQDTRIVLGGPKTGSPLRAVVDAREGSAGGAVPLFDDFTGETGWPTKIRPGIPDVSSLTRYAVRARKKGDAVHRALSAVTALPVTDATIRALARSAASREGIADAAGEIASLLSNFFENPAFRRFFEAGPKFRSFNEREIIDDGGNTFKVDRIIVRPGLVEIIDYKTGHARPPGHIDQIEHYGRLVAGLYAGSEIRKFLLYIDDGEVVEI